MTFRIRNESTSWLDVKGRLPSWSRWYQRNTAGKFRDQPQSKFFKYDIEIEDQLWSLWGSISPYSTIFQKRFRGHQFIAIYVIACCAASVFNLSEWTGPLLDNIVKSGNKYFCQSVTSTKGRTLSLRRLNIDCALGKLKFVVYMEPVCSGKLYCTPSRSNLNLAEALVRFFKNYQYGIVSIDGRALAIGFDAGPDGGFFMYDCQTRSDPLFPIEASASYLLRMKLLHVLHYCIVITLNVDNNFTEFCIYRVESMLNPTNLESNQKFSEIKAAACRRSEMLLPGQTNHVL